MTRPGTRLRSWASHLLDPSTMERLIDPAIADLQHEYEEALRRGLAWRGRWVRITGCIAFAKVLAVAAGGAAGRGLRDGNPAEDRAVGRTTLFSLAATIVLTVVTIWLPLQRAVLLGRPMIWLAWYWVPQALSVAAPMGVVFGILAGHRGGTSTRRTQWIIAALTLVISLAMFANVAWAIPTSNQAFREMAAGRPLVRGTNELALSILRSVSPAQFHVHVAIAFSPLALGLLALSVAAARRGSYSRIVMCAMALAIGVAYYVLLYNANAAALSGRLPPLAGWLANVVFFALALLLFGLPHAADARKAGCRR
jgi:hypothetical protein